MNREKPPSAESQAATPQDPSANEQTPTDQTPPLVETGDGAGLDPAAEEEIWTGRTHWKHFAARIAIWFTACAVSGIFVVWLTYRAETLTFGHGLAIVGGLLTIFSLWLIVAGVLLKIVDHRYRLTSQRLFITRGIFNQTTDQTELIRVDDVRVHKTLADRLFGIGTIVLLTTDATDREIIIDGIDQPERIAEEIRARMRVMRRKSLFVENL